MAPSPVATNEELTAVLRSALGDALGEIDDSFGQVKARYSDPARRPDVLRALKDAGFSFYAFCTGVDYPDTNTIDLLDHVYSHERRIRATVKVALDRNAPTAPTGVDVYEGCNWHEREAREMFGIKFVGHPHPARLLLPDWFEGYPMRKDYELEPRLAKPFPGDKFEG